MVDTSYIAQLRARILQLQSQIIELEIEIVELEDRISSLLNSLDALRREYEILQDSFNQAILEIQALNATITSLNGTIEVLESRIDCVNRFALRQDTLKDQATDYLAWARREYEKIYPDYMIQKSEDVDSIVKRVISIYFEYGSISRKLECDGILPLTYSYDNLTKIDDYYLMRIYAFNEGNVVDRLNEKFGEDKGRQSAVRLALTHLGKVMDKGSYNDKNLPNYVLEELFEIMNNLGFYIIPSKTKDSDRMALQKIITYYNKAMYDSALAQYNKYERFISAQNTDIPFDLANEIKYKIASIIIWQLAPISKDRSIYPKSSWLYNISGDPLKEGLRMIQELLNLKNLSTGIEKAMYHYKI